VFQSLKEWLPPRLGVGLDLTSTMMPRSA